MKNIIYIVLIILSSLHVLAYEPKVGDILFQDGSKNDFNDAVKNVTQSWDGRHFSHCGVIAQVDDSVLVIEAIDAGVVLTSFNQFINRNRDSKGNPKVVVGRLNDSLQTCIPNGIQYAKSKLGAEYDHAFSFENEKFYCSELVYFMFKHNGKYVFETNKMTFKDESGEFDKGWVEHFKKLNVAIPEGEEGINPGGISKSNKIKIIKVYY